MRVVANRGVRVGIPEKKRPQTPSAEIEGQFALADRKALMSKVMGEGEKEHEDVSSGGNHNLEQENTAPGIEWTAPIQSKEHSILNTDAVQTDTKSVEEAESSIQEKDIGFQNGTLPLTQQNVHLADGMDLDSTSRFVPSERVYLKEIDQNELLREGRDEEVRNQQRNGKWKRKVRPEQRTELGHPESNKENKLSCGIKREWQLEKDDGDKQNESAAGKRIRIQRELNQLNSPLVGVASQEWPQNDK